MDVLRTIGVYLVAGAATTIGTILAYKGAEVIANPATKAKIKSKFANIRSKFKKD
jgi:hypothetical protein